ncbi:unnamed protein product [Jaminaea pallidilutea]
MSSLFTRRTLSASRSLASRCSEASSSKVPLGTRHASTSSSSSRTSILLRLAGYQISFDFSLPRLPSVNGLLSLPSATYPELCPAAGAVPTATNPASASEEDVLRWDGILNAVPKSRVSHSRKRMRAANKGPRDKISMVHCPGCGTPKMAHHICATCYGDIARRQKAELKQRNSGAGA